VKREGSCPCGAVRYSIDGPVRDVLVCHCNACREATGAPWAASAAHRRDLIVEDASVLTWQSAGVSEHGARRGRCRTCGSVVFWDAPDRPTVSFAVATLEGGSTLEIAGHIWVTDGDGAPAPGERVPVYARGLPASVEVPWRA
jgi:hypothetical protein